MGPRIDPCGTPNLRGSVLENVETASPIRTLFPFWFTAKILLLDKYLNVLVVKEGYCRKRERKAVF